MQQARIVQAGAEFDTFPTFDSRNYYHINMLEPTPHYSNQDQTALHLGYEAKDDQAAWKLYKSMCFSAEYKWEFHCVWCSKITWLWIVTMCMQVTWSLCTHGYWKVELGESNCVVLWYSYSEIIHHCSSNVCFF